MLHAQTTTRRTALVGRWMLLAVFTLALSACWRGQVLPGARKGQSSPLAEPRTYVPDQFPTEKDPTQIYRIGKRDVLHVEVLKDPSITNDYPVTAEGNVILPYIGQVRVLDLTASEAEDMLNQMLAEIVREPNVKVGIKEYLSKKVYVFGQVSRPGIIVMEADMLTLLEAIVGAGMPTEDAALKETRVLTPGMEKPEDAYQVDLTAVLYKGIMKENILLKPNDIVYVPSRYARDLSGAIRQLLLPVDDIARIRFQMQFDQNNNDN